MVTSKKFKENFPIAKLVTIEKLYDEYTQTIKNLHHKSRDGTFILEYDAYTGVWTGELPIYCFDSLTTYSKSVIDVLNETIEHMNLAIRHAQKLKDLND